MGARGAAPGPRLGPASPGLGPCIGGMESSEALQRGPRFYSRGNSADGLKDCLLCLSAAGKGSFWRFCVPPVSSVSGNWGGILCSSKLVQIMRDQQLLTSA